MTCRALIDSRALRQSMAETEWTRADRLRAGLAFLRAELDGDESTVAEVLSGLGTSSPVARRETRASEPDVAPARQVGDAA